MAVTLNASSTAGFVTTADTSTILQLQTNGTTAVTVDDSQRVGVGVTPSAWDTLKQLDVGSGGGIWGTAAQVGIGSNVYYGTSNFRYKATNVASALQVDGNVFKFLTAASGTAGNAITFTQAMTLDASGNLLVGTTSNPNGTRATIKAGNGTQLTLDNDGSQFTEVYWANNGTNKSYMWWDNTNTRFQIQSGGSGGVYLASTGTSWTSASDERVKDIIEPIENATQKLSDWRAVVGKYKADEEGTRRSFLIAQDVLATFPEAVDTTNADEYGVRYQDTIPVLVKAIQEQQALIETLTQRITALEAKP